LSSTERQLLLQALILLPLVALALRLQGLQATQRWLTGISTRSSGSTEIDPRQRAWITTKMVGRATHYQRWWVNCLKQSLVLWFLLHRQGIIGDLRIGVHKSTEGFTAHAWVEYDGDALNESPDINQYYLPFPHSFSVRA
jgi:hypothetical protein